MAVGATASPVDPTLGGGAYRMGGGTGGRASMAVIVNPEMFIGGMYGLMAFWWELVPWERVPAF